MIITPTSPLPTPYRYPGQFWLMFAGMLISTIGGSMIWPFLMIYVSRKLGTPMTVTASLLTLNAAMGLMASFAGGPLIDRLGRKGIMVFSLTANGLAYLFMGHATSLLHFAILMGITGAVNPLYRTAADTMMADMLSPERRIDGYSLMRLSNNLGVSIGPAIGGLLVSTSYALAFYAAAAGMVLYSLLMAAFARETKPDLSGLPQQPRERFGGYPAILRDRRFMFFTLNFALVTICAVLMWTIMPVYANANYGVPEKLYAYIPVTNALMVVFFQTLITRQSKRYHPALALALGAFFYAVGVGTVGLAAGFWGFWIAMVVMSIGELILAPTASTYAANLAPVDKRGRYIGLFTLSWPLAAGVGPLFGGILNDTLGPSATWLGGLAVGLVGTLAYVLFYRRERQRQTVVLSEAAL